MEFDTVLVVDDEPDICAELSIFLSKHEYRVLTATNGEDALKLFHKFSPAVTITDFRMPGGDGMFVLKGIKAALPQAEVIFISGNADMREAVQAIQQHAFDFLTKPLDLDELLLRVRDASSRSRTQEIDHATYRGTSVVHEHYEAPREASVLYLLAPLDTVQRQRTMQEFQKLIEQRQLAPLVVLSLGRVDYINNVGLNTLLEIHKQLQETGHTVSLVQLSPRVFTYLKTLGYHEAFHIAQSVESAIGS